MENGITTEQVRKLADSFSELAGILHTTLTGLKQNTGALLKMKYAQYKAIDYGAAVEALSRTESIYRDCEKQTAELEGRSRDLIEVINREEKENG